MNKDEAKNFMLNKDIETSGKYGWRHHKTFQEWVNELIDSIYNGFNIEPLKVWLRPRDVKGAHTPSIKLTCEEIGVIDIYNIDSDSAEKYNVIEYNKITLKNCKYPYVYVLKGFEWFFFDLYNIKDAK